MILGALLAGCASMGPQDTERYIFLDESETLFVEFNVSVDPDYEIYRPDLAENIRDTRRQDLMIVMEETLRLYALPIDARILDEREKPGNGPVLEISALRFGQDRSGNLMATIHAKLSRYGELNTLGTYSHRNARPIALSNQQMDKAFRDVIRKPLLEMMEELMRHFPSPNEKASVIAPLTEASENEQ